MPNGTYGGVRGAINLAPTRSFILLKIFDIIRWVKGDNYGKL